MTTQYESFELIIGHKNDEGYPIIVKQSRGGDAEAISQLDPFASEIEDVIWHLKNVDASRDNFIKIGRYLFDNLFVDEAANRYRESINRTQAQNKRLRLCLYIQPPELAALPWEYLYDNTTNDFLAIDPRLSLTRYIPLPNPPNVVQIELPLRILVVISNPSNTTPLDLNKEKRIIEEALMDAQREGLVRLDFVEHATIANINQAMRQFKPHIFHFVGHSSFQEDETVILLVDDMNQAKILSDSAFSKFFSISQDTHLVVLNSCDSGMLSATQRPVGIPYHVARLGIPSIIAMQYLMPNEASYIFAREFYRTLAIEKTAEVAIAEARKALYQECNGQSSEWGIPAFFLRSGEELLLPLIEDISSASKPNIVQPVQPSHPPLNNKFVGRTTELEDLMATMQNQRTQLITGMTGIGKSELVAQFAYKQLEIEPDRVFWYKFRQYNSLENSFIWKLADFLAWHGEENLWQKLNRLEELGQKNSSSNDINYAIQLLKKGDYLICLDDLHLVDREPHVQDFITGLESVIPASKLKLIIISQSVPPFIQNMQHRILKGLTKENVADFLIRNDIDLSQELIAEFHSRIEGNAELLVLSANIIPEQELKLLAQDNEIKQSLKYKIDDTLNRDQKSIMGAIALLSGQAAPDVIEAVIEGMLSQDDVQRNLIDLTSRYLLSHESNTLDGEYIQHQIVQDYYYGYFSNKRRLKIHRRAARYFEEATHPFKAMSHYQKIGDYVNVMRLLDGNIWSFAHHGNLQTLRDVFANIPKGRINDEQMAILLIAQAQLDGYMGEIENAQKSYENAEETLNFISQNELIAEQEDHIARQHAQIARGMAFILRVEQPEDALRWILRGLEYAKQDNCITLKADLLTMQGVILRKLGNIDEALEVLEKARSIQSPTAFTRQRLRTLLALGNQYFYLGKLYKSQKILHEAETIGVALYDDGNLLAIRGSLAICAQGLGNTELAIELYHQIYESAVQINSIREQVTSLLNHAGILIQSHKFEEAYDLLTSALETAPKGYLSDSVATIQLFLAQLHLDALEHQNLNWLEGSLSDVQNALDEACRLVQENRIEYQKPTIHWLKARLYLMQAEFADASIHATKSLRYALQHKMSIEQGQALRVLGQILIAQGKLDEALKKFQESLSCLESNSYETGLTQKMISIAEKSIN